MRHLLILLSLLLCLNAQESYPETFSELGTPLYEADTYFQKLPASKSYSDKILHYHAQQLETRALAQADQKTYFAALRKLAKSHEQIISDLRYALVSAMGHNDYITFLAICDAEIPGLLAQQHLKERVYTYYLNNKTEQSSEYLDKKIKAEEGISKKYGRDISSAQSLSLKTKSHHPAQHNIIILTRPGCGYCVKTKDYLDARGVTYKEHNIKQSAEGAQLFSKHHGTGVPLTIINGRVVRGYNPEAIRHALGEK